MDLGWLQEITHFAPDRIQLGHIRGEMCHVIEQDGSHTHHYPILTLNSEGDKIVALYVTYHVTEHEKQCIRERLLAYEGPLFKMTMTSFQNTAGEILDGHIFVAADNVINAPPAHITMHRLRAMEDFILWLQPSAS